MTTRRQDPTKLTKACLDNPFIAQWLIDVLVSGGLACAACAVAHQLMVDGLKPTFTLAQHAPTGDGSRHTLEMLLREWRFYVSPQTVSLTADKAPRGPPPPAPPLADQALADLQQQHMAAQEHIAELVSDKDSLNEQVTELKEQVGRLSKKTTDQIGNLKKERARVAGLADQLRKMEDANKDLKGQLQQAVAKSAGMATRSSKKRKENPQEDTQAETTAQPRAKRSLALGEPGANA